MSPHSPPSADDQNPDQAPPPALSPCPGGSGRGALLPEKTRQHWGSHGLYVGHIACIRLLQTQCRPTLPSAPPGTGDARRLDGQHERTLPSPGDRYPQGPFLCPEGSRSSKVRATQVVVTV